ncbi:MULTISPECIES: Rieske 2Fe-2S domain-containing protein [Streptomyces]|uniref:Rieske 2Fe-2S domain-containing protein n=1 Tax=Streptomyces TaxID=1883 RepID=UPI001D156CD3|nr:MULTISPECIES: Rieske 2Fe-2S domain-containing protein [Streptomyces]MCC3654958.1 Rieske 2Fe-2S domain-containing protein [Streptomyces sp. S07_1.15]WSQ70709.1 Rieske 2Fe-2S domain-containing protein [Streptomyces xinghaiensis]
MAISQRKSSADVTARRVFPDSAGPGRFLSAVDRLERTEELDPTIDWLRGRIRRLPLGPLRDALHGRWLGHPLHPVLVQVPIGAWLSAAVLDLLPGERREADALVLLGLSGAGPAAVAGWVDWAELQKPQMRVGLPHSVSNAVGVLLYAGSFAARRAGLRGLGRTLGFAGLTVVGIGGALGGHMAYRQASGANHAEDVPHRMPPGWHPVGDMAQFPAEQPVRRRVGEVDVVVVREPGGDVHVLADRCTHMGGPLSEGEVADGCITCPWHGSAFRLSDGWNVRGPATAPEHSFETRVVGGRLEIRLSG